jgi:hypothetical protein
LLSMTYEPAAAKAERHRQPHCGTTEVAPSYKALSWAAK